jgi:hypothetical protein
MKPNVLMISERTYALFGMVLLLAACSSETLELITAADPAVQQMSPSFTQAQFEASILFDLAGENGRVQDSPNLGSVGYPCGVPNSYSWKFSGASVVDVQTTTMGRGPQLAAEGYNQVYNACSMGRPRPSMPNARVEYTQFTVDAYSIKQKAWVRQVQQVGGGASFAEDFVNNEATEPDVRDEPTGHRSVRSGIGNAALAAGTPVPSRRTVEDSEVGYNFNGFPSRFSVDWLDVKAIVVSQAVRCIPNAGTDLSDCNKFGYIVKIGLNSWATLSSNFDGFKTHGGVNAGLFKAVTPNWQLFTSYAGPKNFVGIPPPPVPLFRN